MDVATPTVSQVTFSPTAEWDRIKATDQVDKECVNSAISRLKQRGPVSVLDVGCGTGMMGAYRFSIHPSVARMTGIDNDPEILGAARKHFSTKKAQHEVADFMSYRPRSLFDLVYCAHLLYSTLDPRPALHALWKLVAPGGEIIIRNTDISFLIYDPFESDPHIVEVFGASDHDEGVYSESILDALRELDPEPRGVDIKAVPVVLPADTADTGGSFPAFFPTYSEYIELAKGDAPRLGERLLEVMRENQSAFSTESHAFAASVMFTASATKP